MDRIHFPEQVWEDIIILESEGRFAMVDTGNPSSADRIVAYLRALGAKSLDFIILTHFHSDHFGACEGIAQQLPVARIYIKTYSGCDAVGDGWLLGCAFLFAVQILFVDHFVAVTDCFRLAALQFFFAGVLSLVVMPLTGEVLHLSQVRGALGALLFCGVLSSGVAYTLQCVGQKYVHPVVATLLMSLESVISVLGGWLVLGQTLTLREMGGCAVIFLAVLLAQLAPVRKP